MLKKAKTITIVSPDDFSVQSKVEEELTSVVTQRTIELSEDYKRKITVKLVVDIE